jgi:hypothetical protein
MKKLLALIALATSLALIAPAWACKDGHYLMEWSVGMKKDFFRFDNVFGTRADCMVRIRAEATKAYEARLAPSRTYMVA